jgi:hypothetical protein
MEGLLVFRLSFDEELEVVGVKNLCDLELWEG